MPIVRQGGSFLFICISGLGLSSEPRNTNNGRPYVLSFQTRFPDTQAQFICSQFSASKTKKLDSPYFGPKLQELPAVNGKEQWHDEKNKHSLRCWLIRYLEINFGDLTHETNKQTPQFLCIVTFSVVQEHFPFMERKRKRKSKCKSYMMKLTLRLLLHAMLEEHKVER